MNINGDMIMKLERYTRPILNMIRQYIIMLFFTFLFLYPILWLLINSFKNGQELFQSPWSLPKNFRIDNYIRAVIEGNIGRYFVNSIIIAGAVVIMTTLLSGMTAYGITRLRWKLSGFVLSVFLLGIMIPTHATIVPLFSIFNQMKINNTYIAVIIPHIVFALSIAILILTGFFATIPREMEEAALIDGCSILKAFLKIICPMATPSLVTVAVITFITAWNDLLFPQIFLSDQSLMTLPVGLTAFKGRYSTDYVGMIAAVVITIIPSITVYIILHDKIIHGMTAGAVKG
jgi:raffinose/stachyose/melibiose transport system permease protein